MKKSMISYREYEAADAEFIEDIIRETWQYDRFCSANTARRLAHLYLVNCLAEQTFTQVAISNGIPVGILLGRDLKKQPRHLWFQRFWAIIKLMSTKEGRDVAKAFSAVEDIDQQLLRERGFDYDGELVFFALNAKYRGMGIGRELFDRLLSYMKEHQLKSFFLYTDSSCNFGFYEHQGMQRCGELKQAVPIKIVNEMKFYLYEYHLSYR